MSFNPEKKITMELPRVNLTEEDEKEIREMEEAGKLKKQTIEFSNPKLKPEDEKELEELAQEQGIDLKQK